MKLKYHPEAAEDEREAVSWYKKESPELARRFRNDIRTVLRRILQSPQQFPRIAIDHRRALLEVFPYSIFFLQLSDSIYITAVAHHSREPGYWSDRTINEGGKKPGNIQ